MMWKIIDRIAWSIIGIAFLYVIFQAGRVYGNIQQQEYRPEKTFISQLDDSTAVVYFDGWNDKDTMAIKVLDLDDFYTHIELTKKVKR